MSYTYYKTFDLNNNPVNTKISSLLDAEKTNFTGIVEGLTRTLYWFKNGKYHREDGPAILFPDTIGEYWINDERILFANYDKVNNQKSFELYVDLLKLKGLI